MSARPKFPDRWMRALLRLYPRAFRERFGAEMRSAFTDAFSSRPTVAARMKLCAGSVFDAMQSAGAEWGAAIPPIRPFRLMIADWLFGFRRALRMVKRNPGFAIATMLTLGVGIGATTAVFSVVSATLLKPLPYPNAARLIAISQTVRGDEISVSYPDFRDFQSRTRTFDAIAAFTSRTFTLTGLDEPERIRGQLVSSNLFATLGVHPLLGRDFVAADDQPSGARIVALSHALWSRRFGADSNIVGKAITLDGEPFTVVAVMSPGVRFPDGIVYDAADAWVPIALLGASDRESRDSHPGIVAMGLVTRGITHQQAAADLARVARELSVEYASNKDVGVRAKSAVDAIVGSLKDSLFLLMSAAIVVLLIGCANVAGLLLTRADSRQRELAISVALGASRARIGVHLVSEAALLAIGGGLLGCAIAYGVVAAFGPAVANLPRLDALTVDARALAFAAVATMVVAIGCGLVPLTGVSMRDTQRHIQTRGTTGASSAWLRHAFVVGQVALSLVLVVTSSLLVRSFQRMTSQSGGIQAEGLLTFTVALPASQYADSVGRTAFANALLTRLSALPGVSSAAITSILPFSGAGAQSGIGPVGGTHEDERRTDVAAVSPDYFRTMGVELLSGRSFTNADHVSSLSVAIVDERFANAMFPGQDPIGKRVFGWGRSEWTIVGVARHVKNYGVAAESRQEMYVPYAQRALSRLIVVMRTQGDAMALLEPARAAVREIDPSLPLYLARTMRTVVDQTVAGPRLAAFLSSSYAVTALLVVIVGVHGAISYSVLRRTREIGVRVALGASRWQVLALIVLQSVRLTALGVAIGLLAALGVSQIVRGQLFGVGPADLSSWLVSITAILVVGVVASALPAARALRVSPLIALREE